MQAVVAAATTVTMEQRLRRWNYLVRRKVQIEERIQHYEDRILRLKNALSADGILSEVAQRYEGLGMPKAHGGIEDRMAEKTVRTLDALKDAEMRLDSLYAEYHAVCRETEDIEDAVAGLDPRYQRLLTMYYRDRLHWRDICDELYISKARMYQMLDAAVRYMSWGA